MKFNNREGGSATNVLQIKNKMNVPFNVILDTSYEKPMVKFYDARFTITSLGQLAFSYYVDTFLEMPDREELHVRIRNWMLTAENIRQVKEWLKEALTYVE